MSNEFISRQEIQDIFGCGIVKANQIKATVHEETKKRGLFVPDCRYCLREVLEEMYFGKGRRRSKGVC